MPENNNIMSLEGQLCGIPLAGPESFSQQQLDYLKRALGVDETVLWEDATGTSQSTSCTCSEALTNFELVRITFKTNDQYKQCAIYPGDSSGFPYSVVSTYSGSIYSKNSMWSPDADHLTLTRAACTESNNYGTINNTNVIWIVKVVGVHRIAGGN